MSTITAILCFIVVYLLHKHLSKNFNYWKLKGVPYVKPQFLFGNFYDILMFKKTVGHKLAEMYNEMKCPYFGIWVFYKPQFVVKSPELIRHVLVKDFRYFQDRTIAFNESADGLFSNMLAVLKNPKWKMVRSKMTPAFSSGKIKNMLSLINNAAEDLTVFLSKATLKQDSLEAKEICAKYATDVITSCAFGVEGHSFRSKEGPWRAIGRNMFDFTFSNGIRGTTYFFLPKMVDLFKIKFVPPNVGSFLRDAFNYTLEKRETDKVKRNDIIDILIKIKEEDFNGFKLEGDRLIAQAAQFFFAGFETLSATISYTLYELCLNKSIQEKLTSEINVALQKYNGVTYEALQNIKYLDKVVQEALRKYPALPFLDRMCIADYNIPGTDIVLDKGTPIAIPLFGLHYDPEYFPNPDVFDPERFSEDCINSRPASVYIPFGLGPRNCIGERFGLLVVKIALVHILSRFKLEVCSKTPIPIHFEPKSITLASKVGLPMRFIDKRNTTCMD